MCQFIMRRDKDHKPSYTPLKQKNMNNVAVAIRGKNENKNKSPEIIATGRGKIAREIIEIAYQKGIFVREDSALAEILAQLDLDTPIPSEAIIAVSEILSKVYEANNAIKHNQEKNPFSGLEDII